MPFLSFVRSPPPLMIYLLSGLIRPTLLPLYPFIICWLNEKSVVDFTFGEAVRSVFFAVSGSYSPLSTLMLLDCFDSKDA